MKYSGIIKNSNEEEVYSFFFNRFELKELFLALDKKYKEIPKNDVSFTILKNRIGNMVAELRRVLH